MDPVLPVQEAWVQSLIRELDRSLRKYEFICCKEKILQMLKKLKLNSSMKTYKTF